MDVTTYLAEFGLFETKGIFESVWMKPPFIYSLDLVILTHLRCKAVYPGGSTFLSLWVRKSLGDSWDIKEKKIPTFFNHQVGLQGASGSWTSMAMEEASYSSLRLSFNARCPWDTNEASRPGTKNEEEVRRTLHIKDKDPLVLIITLCSTFQIFLPLGPMTHPYNLMIIFSFWNKSGCFGVFDLQPKNAK